MAGFVSRGLPIRRKNFPDESSGTKDGTSESIHGPRSLLPVADASSVFPIFLSSFFPGRCRRRACSCVYTPPMNKTRGIQRKSSVYVCVYVFLSVYPPGRRVHILFAHLAHASQRIRSSIFVPDETYVSSTRNQMSRNTGENSVYGAVLGTLNCSVTARLHGVSDPSVSNPSFPFVLLFFSSILRSYVSSISNLCPSIRYR